MWISMLGCVLRLLIIHQILWLMHINENQLKQKFADCLTCNEQLLRMQVYSPRILVLNGLPLLLAVATVEL